MQSLTKDVEPGIHTKRYSYKEFVDNIGSEYDVLYLRNVNYDCERVEVLNLTINQSVTSETTVVACDSYEWSGVTYTESGVYTDTLEAANGCDSIATLRLTINQSVYVDTTATACLSFDWYGTTYTESGDYKYAATTAAGCDSIVTLHLSYYCDPTCQPIYTEFDAVYCDKYVWNGKEYTSAGDYTQTLTAVNGCDSIVTMHLSYYCDPTCQPVYTEFDATFCGSIVWNGKEYRTAGDYTQTLTKTDGCDSIVTMHLTEDCPVVPPTPCEVYSEFSATYCDKYVWNGIE
jgi:hypothetical protein